jgi:hypothetical protein
MELYDSLERIDSSAKKLIPLALRKNLAKYFVQELRVPRVVPPLTHSRQSGRERHTQKERERER